MTWKELQNQALHLPIELRWSWVKALLVSIQQETHQPKMAESKAEPIPGLDS